MSEDIAMIVYLLLVVLVPYFLIRAAVRAGARSAARDRDRDVTPRSERSRR